jgi:hypothetical protein
LPGVGVAQRRRDHPGYNEVVRPDRGGVDFSRRVGGVGSEPNAGHVDFRIPGRGEPDRVGDEQALAAQALHGILHLEGPARTCRGAVVVTIGGCESVSEPDCHLLGQRQQRRVRAAEKACRRHQDPVRPHPIDLLALTRRGATGTLRYVVGTVVGRRPRIEHGSPGDPRPRLRWPTGSGRHATAEPAPQARPPRA